MFIYDNIIKHRNLSDSDCTIGSKIMSDSFIRFGYVGEEDAFLPTSGACKIGGWKVNIAVDDRIFENFSAAWDIVKNILIKYRIAESKVIKPEISFMHDPTQCGKQITVYQFYNPNRDWQQIINELEANLREAHIVQGQFSPGDKSIQNSFYLSYRNDLSRLGNKFVDATEAMKHPQPHNPFGYPDPLTHIRIL